MNIKGTVKLMLLFTNVTITEKTRPLPKKVYFGLAAGEWRNCFYNHMLSFKHKK